MAMVVLLLTENSLTAGRGVGAPAVAGEMENAEIETGESEGGGLVFIFLYLYPFTDCYGHSISSTNPGNNLHVSSLSHRVDTRELEAAFAKIGRVRRHSLPPSLMPYAEAYF
jgi:hypothetical protein